MPKRLKILMVSAEAAPYTRGGGLCEVVAGLAGALAARGHKVDLLLPHVPTLMDAGEPALQTLASMDIPVGGATINADLLTPTRVVHEGVRPLLLSVPTLFDRPALYGQDGVDYPDNCTRFAVLARAALLVGPALKHRHDILHGHDWPGALALYHLREARNGGTTGPARASVLTVHNVGYQGLFWALDLPLLGLGPEHYSADRLEFFERISFLKAGLLAADRIVTVSPSYAREILTPEGGCGLDGVLRARADVLSGVLHGVDPVRWDPATDLALPNRFSDPAGPERRRNVQAFRAAAGLEDSAQPLFSFVGELSDDRGGDTLLEAAARLLGTGIRLVIAPPAHDARLAQCRDLAERFPARCSIMVAPSWDTLRCLLAGTDFLLSPSRTEPFNFLQRCGNRYGAVPVVRRVGGLRDGVVDCGEGTDGTGVTYVGEGTAPLAEAVGRAVALYRQATRYQAVQQNAAAVDISSTAAAAHCEALFLELAAAGSNPPTPVGP